MDSYNNGNHQKSRLAMDIGLPAGLILAMAVVFAVDRSTQDEPEPAKTDAVDLVFVLDSGPAMEDFDESMKANCLEKAKGLQSAGHDCRFAVVPFGDGEHVVASVPLTDNLDTFETLLTSDRENDRKGAAASSVEAIEQAMDMDFRKDAVVLFFLVTNTPSEPNAAMAGIAGKLKTRGIKTVIQAAADEQDAYTVLYEQGGRFFSLDGSDLTGPIASTNDEEDDAGARALNLLAPARSGIRKEGEPTVTLEAKGLYALRTEKRRDKWISQLGGSPESEKAVQDGLKWLARHQAYDGHWSDGGKCEHLAKCSKLVYSGGRPIAESGMALLAFQAGGHYYFNEQDYSNHVSRGLDWLIEQQGEDGEIFGARPGDQDTWYQHGIATFALAEACAVARAEHKEPDPRYLAAAKKAVRFMESHQYKQGGWRYALDSRQGGDTSVTGWQVLALKSAKEAEIVIDPGTMEQVQKFYEACGNAGTGQTAYMIGRRSGTDLTTAVGLIVQQFILKQPDSPLAQKAVEHLKMRAATLGRTGDFYTLYNATLAMFLAGGEAWDHWNSQVRDAVLARQVHEGCERGSWAGTKYQRTLATAWAVLTLEVYYRYSPGTGAAANQQKG